MYHTLVVLPGLHRWHFLSQVLSNNTAPVSAFQEMLAPSENRHTWDAVSRQKKERKSDCDISWQHFLNLLAKVTAMSSSHYIFLCKFTRFLCTIFVQLLHANVRLSQHNLRDFERYCPISQAFNPRWWYISCEGSKIWNWICGDHLLSEIPCSRNIWKYFAWSST